ncbi:serine/threonine-protein phosphatase 2A activator [Drosophila sulfurigaster albostrigata]|uniref:serine/threonine-protein phosphatase 2A activator n=1 Tax=Drosophila sulfurigaster albostrigata TaxID=89887 RepID=UPI002D21DFE5|nr:serine/threonine-protein phosphatase 2A activator [Drosophila sulfurigaster albostrigata]
MADANAMATEKLPACEKRVHHIGDLALWQRSRAYHDLIGYINGTSSAIQGIKTTDEVFESDILRKLLGIFDALSKIMEQHPPLEQPQRFGNKAYRDWAANMREQLPTLLIEVLPAAKHKHLHELLQYLMEAFGNATRIDYGTGHELSFLFFLCALFKAEILGEQDIVSTALRLFNRYLEFVRQLQRNYNMEPAGSQGVWSLDDFQFVPFIWGSAQLAVKSPFDPAKFVDEQIINDFSEHYMFISCIDYICKVKTGHFGEHSNQLWSITAVPSWVKINQGLVKMYQKEILSKFPVIQHVYFGELMSFESVAAGTALSNARLGHVAPPPSKRICIGTPPVNLATNLVPPMPLVAPAPPPAEAINPDLNVGDSSSESSDNSVVLRPTSAQASPEGSGDKSAVSQTVGDASGAKEQQAH